MAEAALAARAQAAPRRPARVALWTGGSLLALYAAVALAGPALGGVDPNATDLLSVLMPPSAEHTLGTDQIGRDLLARLAGGARFTLAAALTAVALATAIGTTLGLVAGFRGGAVDQAVSGAVDLLLTIPNLVLAIAIASVIGAGFTGLVMATTASFVPPLARIVRGRVLELREQDFVQAAVAIGTRQVWIMMRHVLPNASGVIAVEASLLAGQAVLLGSALGFLGLGVQPPAPEWGTMLGQGREFLELAPHLVIAPGLAISGLVLAFNFLGDGLRDWLDPAQRA